MGRTITPALYRTSVSVAQTSAVSQHKLTADPTLVSNRTQSINTQHQLPIICRALSTHTLIARVARKAAPKNMMSCCLIAGFNFKNHTKNNVLTQKTASSPPCR